MSYQLYPSDLTDREQEYIKPFIPVAKRGRQDRKTEMRQTLIPIFYVDICLNLRAVEGARSAG
jgi:transposase